MMKLGVFIVLILIEFAFICSIAGYSFGIKGSRKKRYIIISSVSLLSFVLTFAFLILVFKNYITRDLLFIASNIFLTLSLLKLAISVPYLLYLPLSYFKIIRRINKKIGLFVQLIFSLFCLFFVIHGTIMGIRNVNYKELEIPVENLATNLQGFKIVHISDLHLGSFKSKPWSKEFFEKVVSNINAQNPDIIVNTGDFVNYKAEEMLPYSEILSKLKSKYGNYSVIGNHDSGLYFPWEDSTSFLQNYDNMLTYLKQSGTTVLNNSSKEIKIENAILHILGTEYYRRISDNRNPESYTGINRALGIKELLKTTDSLEKPNFRLLLSHTPLYYTDIISKNNNAIDLTLSGHTHGFQLGVNLFGKHLWTPASLTFKHPIGLFEENEQFLYVTAGLGFHSFPFRIGMPPEVTIITLVNKQ